MAFNLDAHATPTTVVAASQQGSRCVVRHVNHPCLVRDSGSPPACSLYTPYGYLVNSGGHAGALRLLLALMP
jgi:hypothetical protein